MVGETIGHFKIVARLGRGGMGEVWLAEQQSIGTRVAVKMLLPEISQEASQVNRFFNEARAVSRIQHAGIAKIFDVGFHEGRAYLVMEYLEGETLGRRLRRVGRFATAPLAEIARQITTVLDATQAAGITHRDLKPDNVFLVPDHELATGERVKVLDFGIAKLTGSVQTRTASTMGTPAYMAPEQWADAASVDWRADAYSLGCLVFELACGRPPFIVTTFADACSKHLHTIPPTARSIVPTVPSTLDELIARLLAKRPEDRGMSMAEIAHRFATIAHAAANEPGGYPIPAATPFALAETLPRDQLAWRDAPTIDNTAPPFGGAAGRGQAPTIDNTAPPFGGAAGRGQAPTIDNTAPPFGGAAGRGQAPTIGTTSEPRAVAVDPPRPRHLGRAIVVVVLATGGGIAGYAKLRSRDAVATAPVDAVTVDARSPVHAAADATAAVPVDAIARPLLDAAPPIRSARDAAVVVHSRPSSPQHTYPHDRDVEFEQLPDEPDEPLIAKITNEVATYANHTCGPWPSSAVGARLRVSFDGKAHDLAITGADPQLARCITTAFEAAVFPRSKHSLEISPNLTP